MPNSRILAQILFLKMIYDINIDICIKIQTIKTQINIQTKV